MRFATYNVEWFNALFDDAGTPYDDGEWSGRHNVTRGDQLAALGIVFTLAGFTSFDGSLGGS